MLKHHSPIRARARHRRAVEQHLAAALRFQPADNAQQRGFAAARSADKGDEFVVGHVQAGVLQRLHGLRAVAELLVDVANGDFFGVILVAPC